MNEAPLPAWSAEVMSDDRDITNIGFDVETIGPVLIPATDAVLVSGAPASGKSYALRTLAAAALHRGDVPALVDVRGEEASVWSSVCTVAVERDEVVALLDQQHELMEERLAELRRLGLFTWSGKRMMFAVDEGASLLAMLKDDPARIKKIERLGIFGRAAGTPLWWATGNVAFGGHHPGITSHLNGAFGSRIALRTGNVQQGAVVLRDRLSVHVPELIERGTPGQGYLANHPGRIQLWRVDDETFRTLRSH